MLAYDPHELLDDGIYTSFRTTLRGRRRQAAMTIHEKLGTLYLQANIRVAAWVGGADRQRRRAGRPHRSESNGERHSSRPTGDDNNHPNAGFTRAAKYWDVMPSLNLSFRFPSDFVIRFGLAREVMRPRMDDPCASASAIASTDRSLRRATRSPSSPGTAAIRELRPFRANARRPELREVFRGVKGYVAAQLFYKKFNSFVVEQNLRVQSVRLYGLPIPAPFQTTDPDAPNYLPPEGNTNGYDQQPYNGKGGKMLRRRARRHASVRRRSSPALEGFGVTGGVGYTKSKITSIRAAPATSLSRAIRNGWSTARPITRSAGFNARGSMRYRSELHRRGVGLRREPQRVPQGRSRRRSSTGRSATSSSRNSMLERIVALPAGPEPDQRAVRHDQPRARPCRSSTIRRSAAGSCSARRTSSAGGSAACRHRRHRRRLRRRRRRRRRRRARTDR